MDCFVNPILEGIFERTPEGTYWFQVLQTCIQDETTPFYVRTTFQPATDRAKPTHCAKKNHLDASGVGHCSGNLCDLAEVLVPRSL